MRQTQTRLLNLDILRLVSAVAVLVYHFGFRMAVTGEGGGTGFPELSPLAIWFDTGLMVFFAISGYVITLSAEGRAAFDFAVGRLARLWPTFVLCASVTAIVLHLTPVPGDAAPTLKQWLAHLVINARVLGQPFIDGAYWTIAYEVMFYGWVFVLLALGLFRKWWQPIAVCWLILSAANELLVDSEVLRKLFITEYSGYFVFGMTLYKLRQQQSLTAFLLLIASLAWATATPLIMEPEFVEMYGIHRNLVAIALTGPIALASVSLCAMLPALPISSSVAIALGGLTYPLYLLHQNIGYAVFARFAPDYGRWLVGLVLVVGLLLASWLIATFFEPAARRRVTRIARSAQTLWASRRSSAPQVPQRPLP